MSPQKGFTPVKRKPACGSGMSARILRPAAALCTGRKTALWSTPTPPPRLPDELCHKTLSQPAGTERGQKDLPPQPLSTSSKTWGTTINYCCENTTTEVAVSCMNVLQRGGGGMPPTANLFFPVAPSLPPILPNFPSQCSKHNPVNA